MKQRAKQVPLGTLQRISASALCRDKETTALGGPQLHLGSSVFAVHPGKEMPLGASVS